METLKKLLSLSFICQKIYSGKTIFFLVWLRNQLISAGLELGLSQTEKSCIDLIIDNFPRIMNKKHKINTNFFWPLGANKTGLNIIIGHFCIRENLI